MSDYNPTGISKLIVALIVSSVLVGSVLIPFLFDIYQQRSADFQLESGQIWSYTPTTNYPSDITMSGNASDYGVWEDDTIVLTLPDGYYELYITAHSETPTQYATQYVTFFVGTIDPSLQGLMFTIPTMLIIGMIIFVIRKMGISSKGDDMDYYNY